MISKKDDFVASGFVGDSMLHCVCLSAPFLCSFTWDVCRTWAISFRPYSPLLFLQPKSIDFLYVLSLKI